MLNTPGFYKNSVSSRFGEAANIPADKPVSVAPLNVPARRDPAPDWTPSNFYTMPDWVKPAITWYESRWGKLEPLKPSPYSLPLVKTDKYYLSLFILR